MLLCFGWTTIGVLRPINCRRELGRRQGAETTQSYMVNASTNECGAHNRLWMFSAVGAFLYGILYPIFLRVRLRAPENRYNKQFNEHNSLLLCGLNHDFIWWDAIVTFKKFSVVFLAHLNVDDEYRIPLQLFSAVVYGAISTIHKQYDHRRDGLIPFVELCFVCTWVLSCISSELAFLTGTATAWLICLGFVIILHTALGIYVTVVLLRHVEHVWLRTFRSSPGPISRLLMARRKIAFRGDPYVFFEHILGWVTLCGNRADQAIPPYVARGREEKFPLGRPAVSNAPSLAQDDIGYPQPRHATKQQRLSLQRSIADTVESVSVGLNESTTFSVSILEFVVRVGFFLGKKFELEEEGWTTDETEDGAEIQDMVLYMDDSIERHQVTGIDDSAKDFKKIITESSRSTTRIKKVNPVEKAGMIHLMGALDLLQDELRTILGMARAQLERRSMGTQRPAATSRQSVGEKNSDTFGDTMSHLVRGVTSLAKGAEHAIDHATSRGDSFVGEEAIDNAIEAGKLSPSRKRQLNEWCRLMFDPQLYQHGIRLDVLQLGLMRLQWMGRLEVAQLVDCFEPHWLVHNSYRCHVLKRYANWTFDAPAQADITASKFDETDPVGATHADYLESLDQDEQDEKLALSSAMAVLNWTRFVIKKGNALTSHTTGHIVDAINSRNHRAQYRTSEELTKEIEQEKDVCQQIVLQRMELDKEAQVLRNKVAENPRAMVHLEQEAKRLKVHQTLLKNGAPAGASPDDVVGETEV